MLYILSESIYRRLKLTRFEVQNLNKNTDLDKLKSSASLRAGTVHVTATVESSGAAPATSHHATTGTAAATAHTKVHFLAHTSVASHAHSTSSTPSHHTSAPSHWSATHGCTHKGSHAHATLFLHKEIVLLLFPHHTFFLSLHLLHHHFLFLLLSGSLLIQVSGHLHLLLFPHLFIH